MTLLAAAAILASAFLGSVVVFLIHRRFNRRHGERWAQPYRASR